MLVGAQSYASTNLCKFNGGNAKITYKGKLATVQVNYKKNDPTYNDCKVSTDQFGKLIDCNTGNRDFMIVISKDSKNKLGGIMSKTLDLFQDIKC